MMYQDGMYNPLALKRQRLNSTSNIAINAFPDFLQTNPSYPSLDPFKRKYESPLLLLAAQEEQNATKRNPQNEAKLKAQIQSILASLASDYQKADISGKWLTGLVNGLEGDAEALVSQLTHIPKKAMMLVQRKLDQLPENSSPLERSKAILSGMADFLGDTPNDIMDMTEQARQNKLRNWLGVNHTSVIGKVNPQKILQSYLPLILPPEIIQNAEELAPEEKEKIDELKNEIDVMERLNQTGVELRNDIDQLIPERWQDPNATLDQVANLAQEFVKHPREFDEMLKDEIENYKAKLTEVKSLIRNHADNSEKLRILFDKKASSKDLDTVELPGYDTSEIPTVTEVYRPEYADEETIGKLLRKEEMYRTYNAILPENFVKILKKAPKNLRETVKQIIGQTLNHVNLDFRNLLPSFDSAMKALLEKQAEYKNEIRMLKEAKKPKKFASWQANLRDLLDKYQKFKQREDELTKEILGKKEQKVEERLEQAKSELENLETRGFQKVLKDYLRGKQVTEQEYAKIVEYLHKKGMLSDLDLTEIMFHRNLTHDIDEDDVSTKQQQTLVRKYNALKRAIFRQYGFQKAKEIFDIEPTKSATSEEIQRLQKEYKIRKARGQTEEEMTKDLQNKIGEFEMYRDACRGITKMMTKHQFGELPIFAKLQKQESTLENAKQLASYALKVKIPFILTVTTALLSKFASKAFLNTPIAGGFLTLNDIIQAWGMITKIHNLASKGIFVENMLKELKRDTEVAKAKKKKL